VKRLTRKLALAVEGGIDQRKNSGKRFNFQKPDFTRVPFTCKGELKGSFSLEIWFVSPIFRPV